MHAGIKDSRRPFILNIAIACSLVTFLAFLPSLGNGFVNWDDPLYVYDNPEIRRIGIDSLRYAFKAANFNWHPLTTLSYVLDYSLWGLNPSGYHLVNMVLHSLNAALVFVLSFLLVESGSYRGAGLRNRAAVTGVVTALLFGLHPLHVESVTWISERKDVLYAFFFLLSSLAYLGYAGGVTSVKRYYMLSLISFVLAVMSKPMAITLPLVFLIFDIYPLRRISRLNGSIRVVLEKAPFYIISLVSAALTIWAQRSGGALVSTETFPIGMRVSVAIKAYIFYLYKMALPLGLAPFYPMPRGFTPFDAFFNISLMIFIGITVFCVLMFRRRKIFLSCWLYYVLTLIPVIGIVQVGSQAAADRYTYLPGLGPFFLAATGAGLLLERYREKYRIQGIKVWATLMAVVFIALASLTLRQERIWKDSVTLWSYEIDEFPERVSIAYYNRANAYENAKNYKLALKDYDETIKLNPDYHDAYYSRGKARTGAGRYDEAISDFNIALSMKPDFPDTYINRGNAYLGKGLFDRSLDDYNRAEALKPGNADAHVNLGLAYAAKGLYDKAIEECERAIALNPGLSGAYTGRGIAYFKKGLSPRAIEDFTRALALSPGDPEAYYGRGVAYYQAGDFQNAGSDLKKACDMGHKFGCEDLKTILEEMEKRQ